MDDDLLRGGRPTDDGLLRGDRLDCGRELDVETGLARQDPAGTSLTAFDTSNPITPSKRPFDCDCRTPAPAVGSEIVGPFEVRVVFCEDCETPFETFCREADA